MSTASTLHLSGSVPFLSCDANDVMRHATMAVQQQASLIHALKESDEQGDVMARELLAKARDDLQRLIDTKSKLEGSFCLDTAENQEVVYPDGYFGELKSVVRSNAPRHLHAKWRSVMIDTLTRTMTAEGKQVLFACVYCCPWYSAAQRERQCKARKNSLFFVYRTNTAFYLSHVSQHSKSYAESVGADRDDEWIIGREVRWMISQLLGGNNKYIQALFMPKEHVLIETDEWRALLDALQPIEQLLTKKLVASCLGQALGAVACHDPKLNQRARQKAQRQQTDTVMILSAAARTDVEPFCSAFRLLQEAHNACTRKTLASTIDLEPEDESDTKSADESGATDGEDSDGPSAPSDLAGDADVTNLEELASVQHVLALLRRTARRSSAEADARLFTLAMRLHKQGKELAAKQSDVPATVPASVSERVAEWLFRLRRESFLAETLPSTDGSDGALSTSRVVEATVSNHDELCTLVQEIGTPLASIPTERILFLVEAGSRMYNLSMPSSDRDFVAIYASPTKQILSCINWPKECADNRGKSLPIEHCCYEARMFTEMLIKGNPNVIEMLFTNNVSYAHPLWEELVARRERLLSESVLQQYVGWVVTHLKLIGKSTHIGREGKLFYHAFHKLGEVERLLERRGPAVRVSGEERDFILRVRKGPLEDEYSIENLLAIAQRRLDQVQLKLRTRDWRYPEYGDWRYLDRWLVRVRRAFFAAE